MKVQIEGRVLGDLAINHIVPTAVTYQNRLLENLCKMKEIFSPEEYEVLSADRKELIREISHFHQSIGTRNDRSPKSCQSQRQLQRESIRIRRKSTSLS
jgi:glutamine synthetase type III